MSENELVLSSLPHTWIFDIDGTVVKHNGYKIDGYDTLLDGVKEFWLTIPKEDYVLLLTSRTDEYREQTLEFLRLNGIRYDSIIFNMPVGERILINDKKPSGLTMSKCVNAERDKFQLAFKINGEL